MMKYKKMFLSIALLLIGCFIGIIADRYLCFEMIVENKVSRVQEELLIEPESKFPIEKLTVIEKQKNIISKQKYKIFLYIDPYCDSCNDKFVTVERMYNILQKEKIGVNVIWKRTPKDSLVKAVAIPKSNQYVTECIQIMNEYPMYIITDASNEIVMMTDEESKVIQKLFSMEGVNKNKIVRASNTYLSGLIENLDKEKQSLVYFAMEGCPDCDRAVKILEENQIMNKYNVLTIYTEESYGEHKVADIGDLFMSLYEIEWYPSFLIMDGENFKFVGKEKESDLQEILGKGI